MSRPVSTSMFCFMIAGAFVNEHNEVFTLIWVVLGTGLPSRFTIFIYLLHIFLNSPILFLQINDIKELISIRGFKLENLNVEGNPFVNRYMDHDHLVRYDHRYIMCGLIWRGSWRPLWHVFEKKVLEINLSSISEKCVLNRQSKNDFEKLLQWKLWMSIF